MFHKVKIICLIMVYWIMLHAHVLTIQAQSLRIDIDGNFQDWSDASQQLQPIADGDFRAYAAFQDQDAIYLHIVAKANWVSLQDTTLTYVNDTQQAHQIRFTGLQGDPFVLSIKDEQYQVVKGATINGSLQNNVREWEVRLPKEVIGTVSEFIFQDTKIDDITILQGALTPPEENETPANPDSGKKILIDGYFDDWTTLHHFALSWQNAVVANACAVLDEDAICVHVGTAYREERHLNLDNIRISINDGIATQIKLREYNKDGSISKEPLHNIKQNKRYEMAAIMQEGGSTYELGKAYYTTKMAKDREDFEFCINLELLEKAMGLPPGSILPSSKIELSFPSIGDGTIIIEGTTTGPWIGIGIGITIVAIPLVLHRQKQCRK